jgi:hypothetical protein
MTWLNDLDGLDLGEPSEDPRATRAGDTFSVVERAAVADGSRFREVQRELRGSKPESRGTEIGEVASDLEQKRNDMAVVFRLGYQIPCF